MIGAAIGFRARTGRAIAIVLSGDRKSPGFVWREEVTLVDPAVLSTEGPYHTVMHLHLPWSEALIAVLAATAALTALGN
ncbi:MAG: hypothetical protein QOI24_3498 [Acidobacteriota bacterium]|jgi:hypothetical protein|nr:hypothetical protein [Acidobacteriota bacterium]